MKNTLRLAVGAAAALMIAIPAAAQSPRQHNSEPLTRAQAVAKAEQRFAKLDLNKDGRVTREEMQQARQQFAQSRNGNAVAKQQAPAGGQRGHHGGKGMMGMGFGADGTMTLEQARATALRHFDHMDVNKDGVVTPAERQQMMRQMRGSKGHQGHDISGHGKHGE